MERSLPRVPATLVIAVASGAAALAAWLAPASVQIVDWSDAGPSRVALLAPQYGLYWLLPAAAAVTLAIAYGGRPAPIDRAARAHIVAPLALLSLWLVPFLPWLPDRLPLLLVLAGPLRWVIAGAALLAVAVRLARRSRLTVAMTWPGRRTAFAAALMLYLLAGLRSFGLVGLGGDEPHYLVVTQSLLADGDLKIENNHAQRDYRPFYPRDLAPHYIERGSDGEIYSIHAPGLPALLVPGYAAAGVRGAVATMCLLGALAAMAIFGVAEQVAGRRVAWLTWVALCMTVPFIPHAWAIYPEIAATAITAWAVSWLIAKEPGTVWQWTLRGSMLAALPWLHTKFSVLLAAAAIALAVQLRSQVKAAAALLMPIAISGAAWLAFFYVFYGSVDPQAPYGAYPQQYVKTSHIPQGLIGLLFDQKFGLLVYAPVYILAVAGAWLLFRAHESRFLSIALVLIAGVFLAASTRLYMWWGGSSAPARFMVPLVPLGAPLLAVAAARLRGSGAALLGLSLTISLLIAATSLVSPGRLLLFSDPHGTARLAQLLQGTAPLTAALPTFTEPDWPAATLRLWPWLVAAAAAFGAARLVDRVGGRSLLWSGTTLGAAFLLVGAALSGPVSATERVDALTRGRFALMSAFDPDGLRAFHYASLTKIGPPGWLAAATLVIEREAGAPADPMGRITTALALPPGRYQASVRFRGQGPHDGHLQLALGRGRVLARAEGPLPNPAVLSFDLPLPVPAFWLQLTDAAAAREVERVELTPLDIVGRPERPHVGTSAIELIPHAPAAHIVHVDRSTFPEGAIFWTRGTDGGTVLVAPDGAREVTLTLYTGPNAGVVRVSVGSEVHEVAMEAGKAQVMTAAVPPGASWFPLRVQAPASFVPASLDPQSSDQRALGCQVRVEVR